MNTASILTDHKELELSIDAENIKKQVMKDEELVKKLEEDFLQAQASVAAIMDLEDRSVKPPAEREAKNTGLGSLAGPETARRFESKPHGEKQLTHRKGLQFRRCLTAGKSHPAMLL
jgi:hypothetical protein